MTIVANCRFLGMFSNLVSPVRPPGIILRSKIILPKQGGSRLRRVRSATTSPYLSRNPDSHNTAGPLGGPGPQIRWWLSWAKRGIPHVVEGLNRLFDSAE